MLVSRLRQVVVEPVGVDLVVADGDVEGDAPGERLEGRQELVAPAVVVVPGIDHVSPGTFTILAGRVLQHVKKTKLKFLTVFGRTPGDRLVEKFKVGIEGRLFAADDEMMLGADAARDLDVKLGDTLTMYGVPFKIVGIYHSDVKFEMAGCVLSSAVVQKPKAFNRGNAMSRAPIISGTR